MTIVTHEMLKAGQLNSELGAYATSNLSGGYDLMRELYEVMHKAAEQPQDELVAWAHPDGLRTLQQNHGQVRQVAVSSHCAESSGITVPLYRRPRSDESDIELKNARASTSVFMEWAFAECENRFRAFNILLDVKNLLKFVLSFRQFPLAQSEQLLPRIESYLAGGTLTPKKPDKAVTLDPETAERLVACFDNIALKQRVVPADSDEACRTALPASTALERKP